MATRWNLKLILERWFYTEGEDDRTRPCWIQKHIGDKEAQNCNLNTTYNLYKNGIWKVK